MAREPIPTWCFALVVVRRGDHFLLVHERKHGQLWYLPAGRVEPGESFAHAAVRETLEETGVRVRLDGILKIEHTPMGATARLRMVFTATPIDPDAKPKRLADEHSLEARWVTLKEAEALPLRGPDVLEHLTAVARDAPTAPIALFGSEPVMG